MSAALSPEAGSTRQYCAAPADIGVLTVADAVGLVPISIADCVSHQTIIIFVSPLNAADCDDAPVTVIFCGVVTGGSLATWTPA